MEANIKPPEELDGPVDSIANVTQIKEDMEFFNTEKGKRVLGYFEEWACPFTIPRYRGDVTQLHIDIGRAELIAHIKTILKYKPTQIIQMNILKG